MLTITIVLVDNATHPNCAQMRLFFFFFTKTANYILQPVKDGMLVAYFVEAEMPRSNFTINI